MGIIKKMSKWLKGSDDFDDLYRREEKKSQKKVTGIQKEEKAVTQGDNKRTDQQTPQGHQNNDEVGADVNTSNKSISAAGGNGINTIGGQGDFSILLFSLGMFLLRFLYLVMYIWVRYLLDSNKLEKGTITETCIGIKYMFDVGVFILGIYFIYNIIKRLKRNINLSDLCSLTLWLFNIYFLKEYVWNFYVQIKSIQHIQEYCRYGIILVIGYFAVRRTTAIFSNLNTSEIIGLGKGKRLGVKIRTSIFIIEILYLMCRVLKIFVDYCVKHQILGYIFNMEGKSALDNIIFNTSGFVYSITILILIYYILRILVYFFKVAPAEAGMERSENNQKENLPGQAAHDSSSDNSEKK